MGGYLILIEVGEGSQT